MSRSSVRERLTPDIVLWRIKIVLTLGRSMDIGLEMLFKPMKDSAVVNKPM